MKLKTIAAVAAVLVLSIGSGALAQFETSDRSPLGVGLTVFRPSGSALKAINDTWLGPAIQYHFRYDQLDQPSAMVSIGWFGNSRSSEQASFVPIGATAVKRFGNEEGAWYVSGGLDMVFAHYQNTEFDSTTFSNRRVSDNGSQFGYHLAFGREFSGSYYVELKRDSVAALAHKTGGTIDFSGWSFSLGSRLAY